MRTKKDWKYYLRFYGLVVVVYAVYLGILAMRDGGVNSAMVTTIIYLPPLFVGFIVIFDRVFEPLFRRLRGKYQDPDDTFDHFIKETSAQVQASVNLTDSDIRELRRNNKFQKGLDQAFRILKEGETKDLNFIVLEKKFKKGTREYDAFQVVIEAVKKKVENQ